MLDNKYPIFVNGLLLAYTPDANIEHQPFYNASSPINFYRFDHKSKKLGDPNYRCYWYVDLAVWGPWDLVDISSDRKKQHRVCLAFENDIVKFQIRDGIETIGVQMYEESPAFDMRDPDVFIKLVDELHQWGIPAVSADRMPFPG